MISIAENVATATREMPQSFHIIDQIDTLSKLVLQSRAVISSLFVDDAIKGLPAETIANLLWLLADRLDEMESIIPTLNKGVLQ